MKYRAEIDGLRALAVVPVVLFHAGLNLFSGGFVGVDIFFVISGYLIASIIIKELEAGKFSLIYFYERRARRILPALFFVVFACIPMAWLWLMPNEMKDFSQSLIAVTGFLSNMLFWRESGYFDSVATLKPLLHTWSLAVEEQYYIIFPLVMLLLWRFGKKVLLAALVVVFAASLIAAHYYAYNDPATAFFFFTTRAWELLLGVFCAIYLRTHQIGMSSLSQYASGLGIVFILISIFAFNEHTPGPSLYTLLPTLGTALIILFAVQGTLTHKLLSFKVFVALGLISYSTYLWHQPLFAFCRQLYFSEPPLLVMTGLMVLSVALAWFSWKYVEAPFRRKNTFGRSQVFMASILCMVILAGIGAAGHISDGFNRRAHFAKIHNLINDAPDRTYRGCADERLIQADLIYCQQATNGPPNAVLFGDSHADDKFYGIEKNIGDYDWALVGHAGCAPTLGVMIRPETGRCDLKTKKIFDYIIDTETIELVVLSFAHHYPLDSNFAADHVATNKNRDTLIIKDLDGKIDGKIDAFYHGIENGLKALTDANKDVIVLLDTPPLPYFPAKCLRFQRDCSTAVNIIDERQKAHRDKMAAMLEQFPDVRAFDPKSMFCEDKTCKIFAEEKLLYRDSHHLTFVGSDYYGQKFAAWFRGI